MAIKLMTRHGLKYTLSDSAYVAMEMNPALYPELERVVESAEVFPSFAGVFSFCVLAFGSDCSWLSIVIYSIVAYLAAVILSHFAFIFFIPIFSHILSIYELLMHIFIPQIVVIVISVFVISYWPTAVVYIIASSVLSVLLSLTINGYAFREGFNNRVVAQLIKKV